eukprot:6449372-Lingulodinium_polyedra.AAC.1
MDASANSNPPFGNRMQRGAQVTTQTPPSMAPPRSSSRFGSPMAQVLATVLRASPVVVSSRR